MTACAASQPPRPELRLVYPALPATECQAEPVAPAKDADDRAIVGYLEGVRLAGADCRTRLKAVHDTQAKWPAPPAIASTAGE